MIVVDLYAYLSGSSFTVEGRDGRLAANRYSHAVAAPRLTAMATTDISGDISVDGVQFFL